MSNDKESDPGPFRVAPPNRQKEMAERGLSEAARAAFGMRDAGFNRVPIGAGPFRFVECFGKMS